MKKIALLTCGRSDYSIYLPLIKALQTSDEFELTVIAFGSHTSRYHGYSIDAIHDHENLNLISVDATLGDDKPASIASAMALTTMKFAQIWECNKFDLVVCLGDRYEMFAAVASTVPFNLKVAHFHGGEKTLGAFDNVFRHSITAMSHLHFVTCEMHAERVRQIIEDEGSDFVHNVGSLALENLNTIELMTKQDFKYKFDIDMDKPTILFTYHPETVDLSANGRNVANLISTFEDIDDQILVTLPNNDTDGARVRSALSAYAANKSNIFVYDFLGVQGYYSAMNHCSFMLGNSSSGIIEAASFNKYVINVGDRQKGRHASANVINIPCEKKYIQSAIKKISKLSAYSGGNIYYKPDTIKLVIDIMRKI